MTKMLFKNNSSVAEMNGSVSTTNLSENQLCSQLKQVQVASDDITFADFRVLCTLLSCTNAFLALIAILANSVIFAAFYRSELLRTPSNLLLLGLAFCDFLVGLITQPVFAAQITLIAANSNVVCTLKDLYRISLFSFPSSSVLHVCIISFERFFAIFYPFKHQLLLTKKRIAIFFVSFWISWTLLTIFTRRGQGFGIFGYSRLAFVILSAFFMLVINVRLWIEARRHSRCIQVVLPSQSVSISEDADSVAQRAKAKNARDSRAAKTILLIIGLLMLCYLPYIAAFSARKFYGMTGRVVMLLWFASNTVALLPAILNPVIYCWRKRDIRALVKRMIGCRTQVGVQRQ